MADGVGSGADQLSVVIKPTSSGDREKFTVTVDASSTVADLKSKVAEHSGVAAPDQRLIYKGKVLKDDKHLQSDYGYEDGHVVHLVGRPAANSSTPTAPAAAPGASTAPPATGAPAAGTASTAPTAPTAFGGAANTADPFGLGGMGMGLPMGGTPQQMQEHVAQMLNNPMMQAVLNNPDLLRSIFQSNPAIRNLMEQNPEFAQLLNNPQLLRESLQMASNPSLLREQMRNTDRVMSNIESHPEGFNMLRRMYENIQEPLMNAGEQAAGGAGGAAAAANPFAALVQGMSAAAAQAGAAQGAGGTNNNSSAAGGDPAPNTAPLPNPWAPSSGGAATAGAGGAAAGTGAAPAGLPGLGGLDFASLGLGGAGAGGPGAAGLGGLGGLGLPAMQPEQMAAILSNPQMQAAMEGFMSTPGAMDAIVNSNPQLRQMMDTNPQLRQMLTNPEVIRSMMNPQAMQAAMQLQAAMQGGDNPLAGLLGPQGLAGATGGTGGIGAPAAGDFLAALNSLGGMGMGAPAPVADPATAYASELLQLRDMGFFDEAENIRALQATGGNVSAAVERLLSSL